MEGEYKMDKSLILQIVRLYVNDEFSTISNISDYYAEVGIKVSKNKISEALHTAISHNLVDYTTAKAIAQKAISNSRSYSGYDKRIRAKYNELFAERKKFIEEQEAYEKIELEKSKDNSSDPHMQSKKDFFMDTFYSSFSDADEFEIDTSVEKEDLESKYDSYLKSLKN